MRSVVVDLSTSIERGKEGANGEEEGVGVKVGNHWKGEEAGRRSGSHNIYLSYRIRTRSQKIRGEVKEAHKKQKKQLQGRIHFKDLDH